jgi:hypothetical protein
MNIANRERYCHLAYWRFCDYETDSKSTDQAILFKEISVALKIRSCYDSGLSATFMAVPSLAI